ncbi:MAG: hypothetical protein FP813_09970 [Desulfurivibrio sp.]|nr:hypothetical protein [Desulfurivibrio sp.]MBU3936681.1 hypothetical protein [Pseudomonadota bacterium]MBU4034106.1 hypothetical protein [Pseudomonadota bacterium]MBU4118203.1 hypothetical protein [Pseudomonadota bacterium]
MNKILSGLLVALVSLSFAGIAFAAEPMMKEDAKPMMKEEMKPMTKEPAIKKDEMGKHKEDKKAMDEMKEMAPSDPMMTPTTK